MKMKKLIYGLMAFIFVGLFSCEKDKADYVQKVVGEYDVTITPNLNVSYGSSSVSMSAEVVETTLSVTKKDDDGNVVVKVEGVNGMINDLVFDAYCDGLGMKMENNSYDGVLSTKQYGMVDCDMNLKNPTVSIYNSGILSWESTASGTCDINISGLDNEICNVSGKIRFEATKK